MTREMRRQTMFKLVERYQDSDIPKRQFCGQHRIKLSTFARWHRIYRKEGNGGAEKMSARPAFIPIRGAMDLNRTGYEYRFQDGNRLLIPESTAISDIITLVNGLQGNPCSR